MNIKIKNKMEGTKMKSAFKNSSITIMQLAKISNEKIYKNQIIKENFRILDERILKDCGKSQQQYTTKQLRRLCNESDEFCNFLIQFLSDQYFTQYIDKHKLGKNVKDVYLNELRVYYIDQLRKPSKRFKGIGSEKNIKEQQEKYEIRKEREASKGQHLQDHQTAKSNQFEESILDKQDNQHGQFDEFFDIQGQ